MWFFVLISGECAKIAMANYMNRIIKLNTSQIQPIDTPNSRKKKPSVLILIQI